MVPNSISEERITDTLATATTAGFSLQYQLMPVKIPFTPGEDMSGLTAADIVDADILAGVGDAADDRLSTRDPATGDYVVDFAPPAGGFQELSGAGAGYPVTVYGWVMVGHQGAAFTIPDNIMGAVLFDDPVTLTEPGQLFTYGDVSLRFSIGAWF